MTSEFFGPLPPSDFNRDAMVRWLDQQVVSFQKIITGSLQADNELSSSNYVAGTSGWMIDGDGNAEFNDVTVRGDIVSGNWDGTEPVDLSSIDTGATQGFALDSSEGNVQIQSLFAAGIALLDVSNNNTQVGAIGGSNDELLINSMTAKNLRLQTLTGGEIQLDPGTGGKTVLNSDTEINGTLTFIDEDEVADVDTLPIIHAVKNDDLDWSLWIEGPNDNDIIGITNPPRIELWAASQPLGSSGINFYAEGRATFLVDSIGIPDGTVGGFPGLFFYNDTDTGIYRVAPNQLGFSAGGSLAFRTSSNADVSILLARDGTVSTPSISWAEDSDTGIYRSASDFMRFVTGGTARLAVDGTGVLVIPTTTGSAANMFISSSAGLQYLQRSTSARKYKSNITDAPELADLTLQPVRFWRDDDEAWYYGFIADDLAEEDPLLGVYDPETGEIENYDQRAVMAVMAAKINRLESLVLARCSPLQQIADD